MVNVGKYTNRPMDPMGVGFGGLSRRKERSKLVMWYCWWFRSLARKPVEVGSCFFFKSQYLQGFIHPRWCRISAVFWVFQRLFHISQFSRGWTWNDFAWCNIWLIYQIWTNVWTVNQSFWMINDGWWRVHGIFTSCFFFEGSKTKTHTPQGTNISPKNGILKMIFRTSQGGIC